jgi:hypothetical protein
MSSELTKVKPRGKEWLGWVGLILLNVGLALRCIGEPALAFLQAGFGWNLAIALNSSETAEILNDQNR